MEKRTTNRVTGPKKRAGTLNRWANIITLDVNHERRYYITHDQIIQM